MGTVAYLSPEQVERGIADPRSDVYAAGIVLFEMLTGAKPYDGETAIQVAYQHVHDDVPPRPRSCPACRRSWTTWSRGRPAATPTAAPATPAASWPSSAGAPEPVRQGARTAGRPAASGARLSATAHTWWCRSRSPPPAPDQPAAATPARCGGR